MLTFIVDVDGNLQAQEAQYVRLKKGSDVQISLYFYKDMYHLTAWNLASATQFNVRAKKLKTDTTYVFNKDKTSTDLTLTDAASGLIKLILNSTDIAAVIAGDKTSFTGQAGDKIKVTIDSVVYDNIDISASTSIDNVVTAINSAVGAVVASKSSSCLRITSSTTGSSSNATIADGTGTTQTVIAELFSIVANRTATGVWGDLSIAQTLYMEIEFQPSASSRIYKTLDAIIDVVNSVE